ncbi:MAG: AMP-binding protein [Bacteroides sp.]|nr:AMP-binding protein [Prevotella sp.]MCM1408808.1 AMP-binding protein [Treponema brennaborense]MCM1470588.1 AMP-binding protein [Bacteroides sp.]
MEQTLPKLLKEVAGKYPAYAAQYYKNAEGSFSSVSYKELLQISLDFGAGLLSLGVKRGDHIGLISDNRKEWFQADMGIMSVGAIDIPRGCDATEQELKYILSFAECATIIAENARQTKKILKLKNDLPELKTIVVLDEFADAKDLAEDTAESRDVKFFSFSAVVADGKKYRASYPEAIETEVEKGTKEDIACIIFTSGTTGEPKGVMLQHKNFITQLDELQERIYLYPGDKAVCVLPVWHVFQRLCEYVIIVQGAAICYSKPIGSILLADIKMLNPQLLPAVPRIFEAVYDGVFRTMRKTGGISYILFKFFVGVGILHSRIDRRLFLKTARFGKSHLLLLWILFIIPWFILFPLKQLGSVLVYKKIRAKLGNAFRGGVSGGGALPPAIDEFFWAIGVNVVEGYGLTETAPVVAVRPFAKPVFGTVGSAIRGVEIRIVDDNGNVLSAGKKGSVQVRGNTVMKGYYNRPDLTKKVISPDGWFDTGDIGMLTVDNELVLRGRKKDTIVLRGGENIEPLPIEMKINESQYILQSVVVGQDERYIGALIVPAAEEIENFAKENGISYNSYESLLKNPEIKKLIDAEIQSLINAKNGFRLFERVAHFSLLAKPFEVGRELSAKQEIMRFKLHDLYAKEIKEIFR